LKSNDDVCVILALDLNSKGLIDGGLDVTTWLPLMTKEELQGEHWLLSYEANVKGWLRPPGGSDHVSAHSLFGLLKGANVYFYDGSDSNTEAFSPPAPTTGSG
jgi:hypothetical protein